MMTMTPAAAILSISTIHYPCRTVLTITLALLPYPFSRHLLWDQPKKDEVPVVEVIEPRPVYAEANKLRGPDTPKFAYTTAPSPASYETRLKVSPATAAIQAMVGLLDGALHGRRTDSNHNVRCLPDSTVCVPQ